MSRETELGVAAANATESVRGEAPGAIVTPTDDRGYLRCPYCRSSRVWEVAGTNWRHMRCDLCRRGWEAA